jgi:hypothetical protein
MRSITSSEVALSGILTDFARRSRIAFPVASVVNAIVFGSVLESGSERALLTSRAHAPEFKTFELQHVYRTLAFLAEVGRERPRGAAHASTDRIPLR